VRTEPSKYGQLKQENVSTPLKDIKNEWVVLPLVQNGQLLASGSADKTIKIWSVDAGECLHTLTGHQDWVWQVAFSSDGQLLASGSGDKTIKIWSIIEGEYQNIDTLEGHESWIWSIAFSPDGQYIASGSEDFTLRLWSVKTRECLQCFGGYGNR
jgi:WD40 repeat protein